MSLGALIKQKGIRASKIRPDAYFPYQGGLHIDESPLEVKPGELRDVRNFEPNTEGGYRRLEGRERFSGKPRPSQQTYKQYFLGKSEASGNVMSQINMRSPVNWTDGSVNALNPNVEGVGSDGVANSSWVVRDPTGGGILGVELDIPVDADYTLYLAQVMLKKFDSNPGVFCEFALYAINGTAQAGLVTIDLKNGRLIDQHGRGGSIKTAGYGIIDYADDWWLVWVALAAAGSQSKLVVQVVPAAITTFAAGSGVSDAAGETIVDNVQIYNIDPSAAYPTRGINNTAGQLLRLERELDDGTRWTKTGSPTLTLDKTGHDGEDNIAYSIEDTDTGSHEDVTQAITVTADHKLYLFSAYVEKKSSAQSYYPAIRADIGDDMSIIIDNFNGVLYEETGKSALDPVRYGISSHDSNWWLVWLCVQNDGTDSSANVYLSPARASDLTGSADSGATGKTAFDLPIFKEFPFEPYIPLNQSALPKINDALPNLLFAPREQDGSAWSSTGTPTVSMDEDGYEGYPNSAVTITDDDLTVTEYRTSATVQRMPTSYTTLQGQVLVKKTTGAITNYPALAVAAQSTPALVVIDTTNGTIEKDTSVGGYRNSGIQSYDSNFWLVWLAARASAGTTAKIDLYPAYNADGSDTVDVVGIGSAVFDLPSLFDLSRGQLLQEDREFDTSPWADSGSPTFGTPETGYDGQASLALNIIDDNASGHEYREQSVTILADFGLYLCQVFVEKESSAPSSYPILEVEIGSTTPRVIIDTFNGAVVEGTSAKPVSSGISSYSSTFWKVWIEVIGDGSAVTATIKLYPAGATGLTGSLATTTGNRTFDHCIFKKLFQHKFSSTVAPRELDNQAVWVRTGTGFFPQNATSYDGVSNKAWTVNDGKDTHVFLNQNVTIVASRAVFLCQCFVGKVSGSPSYYPVLQMGDISGGNDGGVIIDNSANGVLVDISGSVPLDSGIEDYNENYWFVWFTVQNDNTSTSWDTRLYPAGATALTGSLDVTAEGSTVFDRFEIFEYTHNFRLPPEDPSIDPIAKAQVPPTADSFPSPALGNSLDQGLLSPRALDSADWTALSTPVATRNIIGYDGVSNRGYTLTDSTVSSNEGIRQSASFPGSIDHTYVVQVFFKKETSDTGLFHAMRLISSSSNVWFDAFRGEIIRADAWKHQIVDLGVHDYNSNYWLAWFRFETSIASESSDFASAELSIWVTGSDLYQRNTSTLALTALATGSVGLDFITVHKDYEKPHFGLINASCSASPFIVIGGNDESFFDGEMVVIDGKVCGQVSGSPITTHSDSTLDATWAAGVISDARAQIAQVPGTADMRGVVQYNGIVYAFRNIVNGKNVDGGMWKSSPGGWIPVHVSSTAVGGVPRAVFNPKITFTTGLTEPSVGDIIQDHGAVNKARVLRIIKKTGSWGSTAAGYLITSYFQNGINSVWATGDILNAGSTLIATSTAGAPQVREPNGRYEFDIENFFGHAKREAIYGANGVDLAIELHPDGQQEIVSLIETDMTTDKPTHIATWNNYLWLSFLGGSIQNSGLGEPLIWSVILGTDEIGLGEEVSAFLPEKDEAMIIFGREGTSILYDDGQSFILKQIEDESGCLAYTAQKIFRGFFLDDLGISRTEAVLAYGNFKSASISEKIDSLVNDLRVDVVSSHISRRKNLYRISFNDSDMTNLVVGFIGNKVTGITKTNLGIAILVSHSREDDQGIERIFAGSTDGFIYELDSGNSLDGGNIDFNLEPAFNHQKSPGRNKLMRGASLDIVTNGKCSFAITPEFEYGEKATLQSDPTIAITTKKNALIKVRIDGDGTNYRNKISGGQSDEPAWELHGQTNQFSDRRLDRETRTS